MQHMHVWYYLLCGYQFPLIITYYLSYLNSFSIPMIIENNTILRKIYNIVLNQLIQYNKVVLII